MITLLALSDGRCCYLDGDAVSDADAREIAERIGAIFAPRHPRITTRLLYEILPAKYVDCPHTDNPREAFEMAMREDGTEGKTI